MFLFPFFFICRSIKHGYSIDITLNLQLLLATLHCTYQPVVFAQNSGNNFGALLIKQVQPFIHYLHLLLFFTIH